MKDIYFAYELDDDLQLMLTSKSREALVLELLVDIWAESKLPDHILQHIDAVINVLDLRCD